MAIDESLVSVEKTAIRDVKTVFVDTYSSQEPKGKLVMVLAIMIVVVLAIWFIGKGIVGFASTGLGLAMIGISIVSVIFYLWMRQQGVGFKSITGGMVEVALIMMVLVVYIGMLDTLTHIFLQVFPFILLGGIGWIGYKWYQTTQDKATRQGVLALVVIIIIGFPIFEAFVVPYTSGTPNEIIVEVSRDADGRWYAYVELHPFTFTQTMSTQLNPYANIIAETSHWMWLDANTVQEARVDISVQREVPQESVYFERGHTVYVSHDDVEQIWGIIHMPKESFEHYVVYNVIVRVYDVSGVTLAQYHTVYETD